jgi:hypothetical protein
MIFSVTMTVGDFGDGQVTCPTQAQSVPAPQGPEHAPPKYVNGPFGSC